MHASPFLNTRAVETWDTWIRGREHGRLRDLTIEYTWERVAGALATTRGAASRPGYQRRLFDAFCNWQLILDERVLATAATSTPRWLADDLSAVLNIASFVRAPGMPHASIDHALIEEVAALAVFALDDADQLTLRADATPRDRLRIGLIEGAGQLSHPTGPAKLCVAGRMHNPRLAFHLPRLPLMMK